MEFFHKSKFYEKLDNLQVFYLINSIAQDIYLEVRE